MIRQTSQFSESFSPEILAVFHRSYSRQRAANTEVAHQVSPIMPTLSNSVHIATLLNIAELFAERAVDLVILVGCVQR